MVVLDNQAVRPRPTADDLDVFEDGNARLIQQFYLVTTATGSPHRRRDAGWSARLAPSAGRWIFVLLFDEEH